VTGESCQLREGSRRRKQEEEEETVKRRTEREKSQKEGLLPMDEAQNFERHRRSPHPTVNWWRYLLALHSKIWRLACRCCSLWDRDGDADEGDP